MSAQLRFTRPRVRSDDPFGEYYKRFQERKVQEAICEATSKDVASIAARGLNDPWSLSHQEIRTVCASALRQTNST